MVIDYMILLSHKNYFSRSRDQIILHHRVFLHRKSFSLYKNVRFGSTIRFIYLWTGLMFLFKLKHFEKMSKCLSKVMATYFQHHEGGSNHSISNPTMNQSEARVEMH